MGLTQRRGDGLRITTPHDEDEDDEEEAKAKVSETQNQTKHVVPRG